MAAWSDRPQAFGTDETPERGCEYRLLCSDGSGAYALPFPCHWINGVWFNSVTHEEILTRVIGWRVWDHDRHLH